MFRTSAVGFVASLWLASSGCSDKTDSPAEKPATEGGAGTASSSSGATAGGGADGAAALGGSGGVAAGSPSAGSSATTGGGPVGGEAMGGKAIGGEAIGGEAIGGAGTTAAAGAEAGGTSSGGAAARDARLLIFSKTAGYRHDSIPAGIEALTELAAERGWTAAATEDASRFNDAELAGYDAAIFLSTSGDVLSGEQQEAFERFVRAGHGFVGIHAASDTEYDWPWYGELVGAYFREHPAIQAADIVLDDATDAATAHLPLPWHRTDEWYGFRSNPRPNVHVLLSLDESSYTPGSSTMNGDHPIAWRHEHDGGRAFYTALGHTEESYSDSLFLRHVAGGIAWVLGD